MTFNFATATITVKDGVGIILEQDKFNEWAISNQFSTDAEDGEYTGCDFGEVEWQFLKENPHGSDWFNVSKEEYDEYKSYLLSSTRQFRSLKEVKEQEADPFIDDEYEADEVLSEDALNYVAKNGLNSTHMITFCKGANWQKEQSAAEIAEMKSEVERLRLSIHTAMAHSDIGVQFNILQQALNSK